MSEGLFKNCHSMCFLEGSDQQSDILQSWRNPKGSGSFVGLAVEK